MATELHKYQVVKGPFKGIRGEGVYDKVTQHVVLCIPTAENPETIEAFSPKQVMSYGKIVTQKSKTIYWADRTRGIKHNCFCTGACKCHIFSQRYIEGEKTDYILLNQNLVQIKVRAQAANIIPPNAQRGNITEFSSNSRSRMIQRMACLERYPNVWQDFTFPDDVMKGKTITERAVYSSKVMKKFKRQVEKKYGNNVNGIWRREWEDRKSGELEGERCPHFHCLLEFKGIGENRFRAICYELAKIWVQATGTKHEKALAVATNKKSYRYLGSKKMAQVYVSKYVAKEQHDNPEDFSYGRFWGYVGQPEFADEEAIALTDAELTLLRRFLARYVGKKKRFARKITNKDTGSWLLVGRNTVKRLLEYIRETLEEKALQPAKGMPF
jgi:hypothetical protein